MYTRRNVRIMLVPMLPAMQARNGPDVNIATKGNFWEDQYYGVLNESNLVLAS